MALWFQSSLLARRRRCALFDSAAMKIVVISLLWGAAITATSMLFPYEYCMDGPGRGFPFAAYSPMFDAWLPIFAFDESKIPQTLDLGGFIGDTIILGSLFGLVRTRFMRRQRQRVPEA